MGQRGIRGRLFIGMLLLCGALVLELAVGAGLQLDRIDVCDIDLAPECIKPKLGSQPRLFGEAFFAYWKRGDFIKNECPQGSQVFGQADESILQVVKAIGVPLKDTGVAKLFLADFAADDTAGIIERGTFTIYDIYFLPEYIKTKLGVRPRLSGEAYYAYWQDGDLIKDDEPHGNHVFCQVSECIPHVVRAMIARFSETDVAKIFTAGITANDTAEMSHRGKYILIQFGPMAENCAFHVDRYVAGAAAVIVVKRNFPTQFLHYHRAGHGAVTGLRTQSGNTAFAHTKLSHVIGVSGIHDRKKGHSSIFGGILSLSSFMPTGKVAGLRQACTQHLYSTLLGRSMRGMSMGLHLQSMHRDSLYSFSQSRLGDQALCAQHPSGRGSWVAMEPEILNSAMDLSSLAGCVAPGAVAPIAVSALVLACIIVLSAPAWPRVVVPPVAARGLAMGPYVACSTKGSTFGVVAP